MEGFCKLSCRRRTLRRNRSAWRSYRLRAATDGGGEALPRRFQTSFFIATQVALWHVLPSGNSVSIPVAGFDFAGASDVGDQE